MRIVEIRESAVPLSGAFSNAVVSFAGHKVSLVAVVSDQLRNGRPLTGVAFNSIGRHSQSGILRERVIPRLLDADPDSLLDADTGLLDPARVLNAGMRGEKPGGHGDRASAIGAVELAVWDLLAKWYGEPAYATIARAFGTPAERRSVPVYAAGGYYRDHDNDVSHLRDEIKGFLDRGYAAVKIKIGGLPLAEDLARLEAAIEVTGDGSTVAVDANGRFDREQALAYARGLAPYGVRWYEEPVDPLDFHLTSDVAASYDGTLAVGENLFSSQDVANLLRYGGVRPGRDILQMDAGLSYGLTEYVRMIDLMGQAGFDRSSAMPHGGHLINLHIVTGLGLGGCEAYPGVFWPFGGYSDDCRVRDGRITVADHLGFGLEHKDGLSQQIAELTS